MVVVVIQFLIYPLFVEKNVHFLPWMNPRAEINPASMSVVGPQGEICRAFGNVFHRWYAAYRTRTEHQARSRWYTSLIEHHVASYSIGAIYIYLFFFFNHRIFEAWKKLKERKGKKERSFWCSRIINGNIGNPNIVALHVNIIDPVEIARLPGQMRVGPYLEKKKGMCSSNKE